MSGVRHVYHYHVVSRRPYLAEAHGDGVLETETPILTYEHYQIIKGQIASSLMGCDPDVVTIESLTKLGERPA
jgi:hypothetical protein